MNDKTLTRLENKRDILCAILLLSLLGFICSYGELLPYPHRKDIVDQVLKEPVQTLADDVPFYVKSEGREYKIVPIYNYELYGMVVSVNNKMALKGLLKLFNSYDFLNVNDLCVIWGANINTAVYKYMKFSQGAYTCYAQFEGKKAWAWSRIFDKSKLSHNHLLSNDPGIIRILSNVKKGDQIYLRGKLADYYFGDEHLIRRTSTSRADRSSGACETVFLTDFKIIKSAHPVAKIINRTSFYLIILCVCWITRIWLNIGKTRIR